MNPKSAFRLLVSLLVLSLSSSLDADEAAVTALRCGRLLDPASGSVTEGAVVVVRGGRIEAVGHDVPAGAKVVDLSRYTCLPGLIDSHVHALARYKLGWVRVGRYRERLVLDVRCDRCVTARLRVA